MPVKPVGAVLARNPRAVEEKTLERQDFGTIAADEDGRDRMSAEGLRVLVLEDEPTDAELALLSLAEGGFRCLPTLAAGRTAFERRFQIAPDQPDHLPFCFDIPESS